jgi:hypothetical protein
VSGERLTVHVSGQVPYASGERVTVSLPVTDTHLFDAADGGKAFARR